MKLSVVIPCYNSEKTIEKVIDQLDGVVNCLKECEEREYILVNDCSKDNTFAIIKQLAETNSYIIGLNLAKNCGQHAAIMAGLKYSTGDYVVISDDDGQTPIENLPLLFQKIEEGFDAACAKYIERNQPSFFRRIGSYVNNCMYKWLIAEKTETIVSVFILMKRVIVDEICRYNGPYPYVSGLVFRVTHNIANVEMEQLRRKSGISGYSIRKLISLWLNGFTAFSIKPLRISTICGMSSAIVGIIYAVVIFLRRLFSSDIQTGWSSIACILLILGGIILFTLGIMGEYIGRIYLSINGTPQFVIKETTLDK